MIKVLVLTSNQALVGDVTSEDDKKYVMRKPRLIHIVPPGTPQNQGDKPQLMLIPFGVMDQLWSGLDGESMPIQKYSVIYPADVSLELQTHYNQSTSTLVGASGSDVARFGK